MRGLDHPSIVRLLNFAESDEHYFLTLEYVPFPFSCDKTWTDGDISRF